MFGNRPVIIYQQSDLTRILREHAERHWLDVDLNLMNQAADEIDRQNNLLECVREFDLADENASFDGKDHPIVKLAKENDDQKAEIERLNVKFEALVDKSLSLVGEAHEYRMEIERLKADAAPAFYKLGNGEWTTLAPSERGDK
jgi:hypothetical protein